MKITKENPIDQSGTVFQGYLYAQYGQLVQAFGDPYEPSHLDTKSDVVWVINTPYGIATIYNYKNGKRYLGDGGLDIRNIYEWHAGGNGGESYIWAKTNLSETIGLSYSSDGSKS